MTRLAPLFLALGIAAHVSGAQGSGLWELNGEWIFVEDRTEGRAPEDSAPPMNPMFSMRIEEGVVILVRGHGKHRHVRVALDGSVTEVADGGKTWRYRGAWKDGVFAYHVDVVHEGKNTTEGTVRREFRVTGEGIVVRVASGSSESVGLYRHPEDITMPSPTKAVIADVAWLAGAWIGNEGSVSIEERWTPPLGDAMLGVSRSVARGEMVAFEYVRIVERDGGLVYVAQPGGSTPTEFVLTEHTTTRAVFDNPRHDYPQRIVYELTAEGELRATISYIHGGSPRRFEFTRQVE